MKHKLLISVSPDQQKSRSDNPDRLVIREKYQSSIIRDRYGNLLMSRTERIKTIDVCESVKGGCKDE